MDALNIAREALKNADATIARTNAMIERSREVVLTRKTAFAGELAAHFTARTVGERGASAQATARAELASAVARLAARREHASNDAATVAA